MRYTVDLRYKRLWYKQFCVTIEGFSGPVRPSLISYSSNRSDYSIYATLQTSPKQSLSNASLLYLNLIRALGFRIPSNLHNALYFRLQKQLLRSYRSNLWKFLPREEPMKPPWSCSISRRLESRATSHSCCWRPKRLSAFFWRKISSLRPILRCTFLSKGGKALLFKILGLYALKPAIAEGWIS